MTYVPSGAPWSERGGRMRGVIDLVAGRYPPFLFGLPVGGILPVFHFHETTVDQLEPAFAYLAANGYRTLVADEMAAVVRGAAPPPRGVLLAFDDALASLWLVAVPLLRRYGLRAVTYAIPGRVADAEAVRPTLEDGPVDGLAADTGPCPLATWPELRAMAASGLVDVQSHTWSHSMIFCSDRVVDLQWPERRPDHYFNRPRLNAGDPPTFLEAGATGYPLFARRSRMSDARRFFPDAGAVEAFRQRALERGSGRLGDDTTRQGLLRTTSAMAGRWESAEDRQPAIEHELVAAREVLESKLATRVKHVCLPWGVTSPDTRQMLERLGFETAVANRLPGMYAVRPGDDPYYLKRLPHRHIFALPGRGRRAWRTFP